MSFILFIIIIDKILITKILTQIKIIVNNKKFDKILTIILNPLNINFYFKLQIYFTPDYIICQEKLFDKIRQIATDATIPVISAIRAATNTNLIFLILTELV